ncbi:MAG: LUD domain-containing protein [Desulfobacterales bacterium]|nr:LUD domain-containing protein [Desulfobacterales bacterium]
MAHYLYQHYRSHRLVAGNDPRLAAMPWRDAGVLPRFGSVEPGEPVALSFARLGIAETGTIVTWTGKANPAANNLLPEHHIVLVDSADLVPCMEQAWEKINQDIDKTGRPRGINFIAGPSSTADIEGQLVYGAHGPRSWHVILMGDVPLTALEEARAIAAP